MSKQKPESRARRFMQWVADKLVERAHRIKIRNYAAGIRKLESRIANIDSIIAAGRTGRISVDKLKWYASLTRVQMRVESGESSMGKEWRTSRDLQMEKERFRDGFPDEWQAQFRNYLLDLYLPETKRMAEKLLKEDRAELKRLQA